MPTRAARKRDLPDEAVRATWTPCGSYTAVNVEQSANLDVELREFRNGSCAGHEDLACTEEMGPRTIAPRHSSPRYGHRSAVARSDRRRQELRRLREIVSIECHSSR